MKKVVLFIITLFLTSVASAATWQVTGVLSGSDGGFGFSSLHDASVGSVMSGTQLATIDGASGTYNDVTGAVNYVFSLSNSGSLVLTGTMLFNGAGWLTADSSLAYSGLNLAGISSTGSFGYMPGDVCCGGSADPNSFTNQGSLNWMTLWGADGYNGGGIGGYDNSTIGMDFRVELSQVPVPAALFLFAPALLGFFGLRRKVTATA